MATKLAQFIMDHAAKNYEAGGWDVIVECWTLDEIDEHLNRYAAVSEDGALKAFAPLIDVWSDRQADADYYNEEARYERENAAREIIEDLDGVDPFGWSEIEGGSEQ